MRVGLRHHVGGQQHTRENSEFFLRLFFPRLLLAVDFVSLVVARVSLSVCISTDSCSLCPLPSLVFSDRQLVLRRVVPLFVFTLLLLRRHLFYLSLHRPC